MQEQIEALDQKSKRHDGNRRSYPGEKGALVGGVIGEILDHACLTLFANNVRIGLPARTRALPEHASPRLVQGQRPLELGESAGETAWTCDTKTHAQFGVFQNLLNRIGVESRFS